MVKQKISIIGAGSWGTTLAIILSKKKVDVDIYSVFDVHNKKMGKDRENKEFLKGTKFPPNLNVVSSLDEVFENNIIITAVPVKFIRSVLEKIRKNNYCLKNKVFVSVSKGIEVQSLKRATQIIGEELGEVAVAALSGPNIAKEVLAGIPTTSVLACKNRIVAKRLQEILNTPTFRVYMHQDVIGVELGGALKNIVAVACGISDGLRFGSNTKSALVTRGLVEIMKLGKALGANPLTFWGLSGLGDLTTTCFSPYSRNRFVGEEIGKGKKWRNVAKKMGAVAEGLETAKSAYSLSKKLKIDMPITKEVFLVLYKNKSPQKAVADLMKRPLKAE